MTMYTVAPFGSAAAAAGMRTVADVFTSAWPLVARMKDEGWLGWSSMFAVYTIMIHDDY